MRTTNGNLTNLFGRLSALGLTPLILLGIALVVVTGLVVASGFEHFAATSDSIQVAPLRWFAHRC